MFKRKGFTIAELLIVIAIISIIISIVFPAFRGAKRQAKTTASQSRITAIEFGIESFQGEFGRFPPSRSNRPDRKYLSRNNNEATTGILFDGAGANLLYVFISGPNNNGTPKYTEQWADNVSTDSPLSGPYVDGTKMANKVDIQGVPSDVYVDLFGNPFLYYKAGLGACSNHQNEPRPLHMVSSVDGEHNGIYDFKDNATLTSSWVVKDDLGNTSASIPINAPHSNSAYALPPQPESMSDGKLKTRYSRFDQTIFDLNASQFNGSNLISAVPKNRKQYIIISAGYDKIYGTTDDVTNLK